MSAKQKDPLKELYQLAKIADKDDRTVAAFEILSVYLKRRPKHSHAWLVYGEVLRTLKRFREADCALLRALKFAPRDYRWTVQARIGLLRCAQGRFSEAETWYARACNTKEGKLHGWLWILRGSNLADLERFRSSERCLRLALTLDDASYDEAYLNLAMVMRSQERYDEAIAALNQALQIDPRNKGTKTVLKSLEGYELAMKNAKAAAQAKAARSTRTAIRRDPAHAGAIGLS